MDRAITVTFLLLSLSADASGVYSSIGPDGVVQYSDRPLPGSTKVPVPLEATPENEASARTPAPPPGGTTGPYDTFEIALPATNAIFRSENGELRVSLLLAPALLPGHSLRILVDGQPVPGDASGTQLTLNEVSLGTHSLQAQILDELDVPVANTGSVTFHMRKPIPEPTPP